MAGPGASAFPGACPLRRQARLGRRFRVRGDRRASASEALCWANGAFLCALALARGAEGEEADGAEEIDDLPYFTFRNGDGDVEMYPSAEVFWGQRAADAALARGVMPLVSVRDRNVVRLARLQSIADPARALGDGAADDGA